MLRVLVPTASAVLVLVLSGCSSLVPSLYVTPRWGSLEPKGDVGASAAGLSGTASASDLGLEREDGVFEPRIDFSWGPLDVWGTYTDVSFEGDGVATVDLEIGGETITAGDPVSSRLDLTTAEAAFTFDFIPTNLVDIGLGLGVRGIDYTGRVESLTTNTSLQSSQQVTLPVLAGRAAVALGDFRISAIGTGIGGTYDEVEAMLFDLDVMAQYTFDVYALNAGLVLGYRYLAVQFDYEEGGSNIESDLTFDGPYIGLTIGI